MYKTMRSTPDFSDSKCELSFHIHISWNAIRLRDSKNGAETPLG